MKGIIVTFLILIFWGTDETGQVAVIANKSVPVDKITRSQLLDFYTRDIRLWENDRPIVVLDLKPKTKIKKEFYKLLGKSTSRMKSIWMKKLLSGEGDPPEALKSEEAVLKKVASTPGAIGYVSQSVVTKEVKVLIIVKSEKKKKGRK